MIVVVDFGSQTAHLISRRVRELGAEVITTNPKGALKVIEENGVQGIIFSGGPAAVYDKSSPTIDQKVLKLGLPVLGICYGQQLIAHLLGGKVKAGKTKEYGPAEILTSGGTLFSGIPSKSFRVWMSHGDEVTRLPHGFKAVAKTQTIPYAAIENSGKAIYGLQFHPEVVHTQFGEQILENFLKVCGIKPAKKAISKRLVEGLINDIKDSIGDGRAICALSGGVDSSVAALLVHKAIGKNLTAIYVDSGLMREGETESLQKTFKMHYEMNLRIVKAQALFLKRLRGVSDPEKKRGIIGKTFIDVFEKEAGKTGARFLVQGTIYPDVIESAGTLHSKKIKTHHNVAGLPKKMNLALIEPLRTFYKDEVRRIGKILGLPKEITQRQPFPGPGLAVRIIGPVDTQNISIVRRADKIVQEETEKSGIDNLWQIFAVYTGIKTTGVRGDNRAYGETIAVRAVRAKDAMTARWAHLPESLLDKISTRIVNEIKEVNRVVYDITNKPPATIEWE
ncbi:MAG: glutamine-hydrolyzing GMP synthase [bacterium]|nr:glutamine-hydrolyzing GMP synthase [bacterium]